VNAIVPLSLMRPSEARVSWGAEAIETVMRLSAEGKSAGQIAKIMSAEHPGITRNAVIGKLSRLGIKSLIPLGGLVGHAPTRPKRPRIERRAAPRLGKLASIAKSSDGGVEGHACASLSARVGVKGTVTYGAGETPDRLERASFRERAGIKPGPSEADPFIGIEIADLTDGVCHFPQGDPRDLETFRYCGTWVGADERYCPGHRRVMYAGRPAMKPRETLKIWNTV